MLLVRYFSWILLFIALLALFGLASGQIESFDIFWQMHSGRYLWETGNFVRFDTFSLAAAEPRWEHCWLHDLIFYATHQHLDADGISLLTGLLLTLTAAVLVWVARLRGGSVTAILLILPAFFAQTHFVWSARPQLWSYLLFAVFLLLLERHRQRPDRIIWLLLPLMMLWANLHAGAIIAFPVLLAYAVGVWLDSGLPASARETVSDRNLWLLFPGLTVATLLTPYGILPLRALFVTPTLGEATAQMYNVDWRGTSYVNLPQFYWGMGLTALALIGTLLVCRRAATFGTSRFSFCDLLLLGGLAAMGLKMERHAPFFLMAAGAFLPRYVEVVLAWLMRRWQGFRVGTVLFGLFFLFYFSSALYERYGWFRTGLLPWLFPIEAADFIREHHLPKNLFNSYTSGSYLMWALYPEYLVFQDNRQNSQEFFEAGLDVAYARPDWEEILERYEVNTIVTEALAYADGWRYRLLDQLRPPEWAPVHADRYFLVYVRASQVDPQWLSRHRLPPEAVEQTILSSARLLANHRPPRANALLEEARVLLARGEGRESIALLEQYFSVTPREEWNDEAVAVYQRLSGRRLQHP